MKTYTAILITDNFCLEDAEQLAQQLDLPLVQSIDSSFDFYLSMTPLGLALCDVTQYFKPLIIDFLSQKSNYRKQHGGGRNEPLAKAIGIRKGKLPYVLDATAGLGRDAFVLASLGCPVLMLERHPVIWALLNDALQRLCSVSSTTLTLQRIDANNFFLECDETTRPDVVYLDPMYPHRESAALVKKEMQILRKLAESNFNEKELLTDALACAKNRVVVKRPAWAQPLGDIKPSNIIKSGNHRFDIYIYSLPLQREPSASEGGFIFDPE